MGYEINIAKNGHHYFATADRSLNSPEKTLQVYDELKQIYTKEKGFEITISKWQTVGEYIEPEKMMSK